MATGVTDDGSGKDFKGLITGHAYTLKGVAEYKGEKLVQVRNPWGSDQYKGPWSDSDTAKWTEDALKTLNHVLEDDGMFWVPLNDFKNLFYDVSIALYQDWKQDSAQAEWD
jgi:hypothetical protein